MNQGERISNGPGRLVGQVGRGTIQDRFFVGSVGGASGGMDKDSKPEAVIPVALMTSWRRAMTSKGWAPPRHSDSNLTTLGPQRVNTGRGIFCDNIIVRRALR